MYKDPRGGSNQKSFNEDFFKSWSPSMAYILGFVAADGAIIDARKSSRTCYTSIKITDKKLLVDIKREINSSHEIYTSPKHYTKIRNKIYLCKKAYTLRFGSKTMFQDLINLGITPRKSLRLKLPAVPTKYLPYFFRGYFDGDGCIYIYKRKNNYPPILQLIFTSGCKNFLEDLSKKLSQFLSIKIKNCSFSKGAYQIRYKNRETVLILKYMYKKLTFSPYLERKYLIAKPYLKN